MATKHFLESKNTEIVDPETGEIHSTETTKIFKINMGKQDEFFMTFCKYLSSFYQLKYADDIKMIIKFNEWAEFDTGDVDLTAKKRLEITEQLGIRNDSISKSLKRLREGDMISGDKGSYRINPIIFWKGDKAKRAELLRSDGLKVEFNFKIEE